MVIPLTGQDRPSAASRHRPMFFCQKPGAEAPGSTPEPLCGCG